jgi:hypothetical protein
MARKQAPGRARKPVKTAPRKTLTVESAAAQIVRFRGNLSAVARHFGIARQSVQGYVAAHADELAGVVADAREARLDEAEDALGDAVRAREAWAVCFTLKTLGKSRGYVERQEITGKDGAPVETTVRRYVGIDPDEV